MRNLIRMLQGEAGRCSRRSSRARGAHAARRRRQHREGRGGGACSDGRGRGDLRGRPRGRRSAGRPAAARAAARCPSPPAEIPQSIPPLRDLLRNSMERFRDVIGEHSDDRSGVIDPGGADLHRPPSELDDAGERARVAAEERAARDAARAPYRAPEAGRIEITRFATTGRAQLDDLAARLARLRPDRVFGVYRVADRLDVQRDGEAGAYMEWAIVHAPEEAGLRQRRASRASVARTTGCGATPVTPPSWTRTSPAPTAPARGSSPSGASA